MMSLTIFLRNGLLIILLAFAFGNQSYASDLALTRDNIINAFDAGEVQQRLTPSKQPQGGAAAYTSKGLPPPHEAIAEGDKIFLKLKRINFKGNKVFSSEELNSIFSNYLNKTISLTLLQSLVDSVTNKYRLSGYILSRAYLPPQVIANGVVQIEIVEGYISEVHIEGDAGNARSFVKNYGDKILLSRPLKQDSLESNLLLANDLPGLTVKGVITPSTKIKDSADLTLYVTHQTVNAYVAYDNYGTRYLGPKEISYGVTFNSLLFPGDSNAFRFMTTSQHKEVQYAEFVHGQALGSKGLHLDLGTNYTQTQPGYILTGADVISRSASIYSNLIYPLIRLRNQNLNLKGQANYQNVSSTILGFPFYQDRFRTLAIGGDYNGSDRWRGYDTLALNLMHGFGIWGAQPHFYQSRPEGQPVFTLSTFSASRLQSLPKNFSIYIGTQGQYSWNTLLATEQFGFGGPNFGRGYDPYEISGDRGIAGKLELRYQLFPGWRYFDSFQVYAFYDAGMIWNIDSFDLPGRQDATSTGGGTRVHFMNNLDGELFIGKPLTIPVAALRAMHFNGNQARVFFQIIAHI